MSNYSKKPLRAALREITEDKQAPCLRSARRLPADVVQSVRHFARELQNKKKIPASVNVETATWTELCDHLSMVDDKGLVKKILEALMIGFTVIGATAATSQYRHPHGKAQAQYIGNRQDIPALVQKNATDSVYNLTGTLKQIHAPITLPKVEEFIRNAGAFGIDSTQRDCMNDYNKMGALLKQHITHVKALNPRLTASQDTLGIRPGTHIYYNGMKGIKILSHHGVYVGDGLVVDVGSMPDTCSHKPARAANAKSMKLPHPFKAQGIGLTNLAEFASRGQDVYMMRYRKSRRAAEVLDELEKTVGPQAYALTNNNCEHFATEIVTGVKVSHQIQEAKIGFVATVAAVLGAVGVPLPQLARRFLGAHQAFRQALKGTSSTTTEDVSEAQSEIKHVYSKTPARTTFHSLATSRSRTGLRPYFTPMATLSAASAHA